MTYLILKKYIIDKGGEVFFAIKNDKVIATAAMVYADNKIFELAKMTVAEELSRTWSS